MKGILNFNFPWIFSPYEHALVTLSGKKKNNVHRLYSGFYCHYEILKNDYILLNQPSFLWRAQKILFDSKQGVEVRNSKSNCESSTSLWNYAYNFGSIFRIKILQLWALKRVSKLRAKFHILILSSVNSDYNKKDGVSFFVMLT